MASPLQQGKYQDALADCNKALELDSTFTKVYSRRAACYMELEEYENAVRDYRQLSDVEPGNRGEFLLMLYLLSTWMMYWKPKQKIDILPCTQNIAIYYKRRN
jgi:tetratricopeptide (TPR) repeat protein